MEKKTFNWSHSSVLNCFSITRKLHESFPARQTLRDNFIINRTRCFREACTGLPVVRVTEIRRH